MKKLFFAALLATVAVGGAYAEVYNLGSSTGEPFSCESSGSGCLERIGGQQVYLQGQLVTDSSIFQNKEYQPE